jgi:hypothetical protein
VNGAVRQILGQIVTKFGTAVAEDARRCEAILRDLCGQHRKAINVLVSAVKEKVVSELLNSSGGIPPQVLLARLSKKLHDSAGIDERLARWGVQSWALALGVIAPHTISNAASTAQTAQIPVATSWDRRWLWGIPILFGVALLIAIASWSGGGPEPVDGARKEKPSDAITPGRPIQKIISSAEASQWEEKEVTVRVVVKSTYDGFNWAFLINSEEDFRDPRNFTVVVETETAGAKYQAQGIFNLGEYFKRDTVLLVTGKVVKYNDRQSGKKRYQIKVKDPGHIQRQ